MKTQIALLALLLVPVLTACGGSGGSPDAHQLGSNPGVALPAPTPASGPIVSNQTLYTVTQTAAPINGWPTKTYTAHGYCMLYNSVSYCWDDGVRSLSWSDINGNHYGPFTYTYFGVDASFGPCHGGCATDLVAQPIITSANVETALTVNAVNNVYTTGVPSVLSCSEDNGLLDCGSFVIDLNQVAL